MESKGTLGKPQTLQAKEHETGYMNLYNKIWNISSNYSGIRGDLPKLSGPDLKPVYL